MLQQNAVEDRLPSIYVTDLLSHLFENTNSFTHSGTSDFYAVVRRVFFCTLTKSLDNRLNNP